MAPNNLTVSNNDQTMAAHEDTRSVERYVKPAVDIMETAEGLTITADMPGAAKDGVDVNIDKGVLTISATVKPLSHDREIYREFGLANYYRQFQVPDSIDGDRVKAEFTNGVLTLTLLKAEAAKPRRIAITTA